MHRLLGRGLKWGDVLSAEDSQAAEIIRVNAAAAPSLPGKARRAQHAKHHGCVTAIFEVRADVPADLRQGLFADPQRYTAAIRFSNSRQKDDRQADTHGMAIKLTGVPGEKLLPGEEHETAQDFLLVDSEVFITGDGATYTWLNKGLIDPGQSVLERIGFWASMMLQPSLLLRIMRVAGGRPTSPLTQSYYSTTPYSCGAMPVKWVVRPASNRNAEPLSGPDGLAEALQRDLADAPFQFDFGVDVQVDPAAQPIEDPTVAWSQAKGARRVWLATITIPTQTLDRQASLAEDISYSPWHGLIAHTPLGAINQLRKPVYRELAIRRHKLNGVSPPDTSELPPSRTSAGDTL